MFLVHGAYRFWPRRIAFRNDYCLTCDEERLAVRVRTFVVLHLFWIPLLPLGLWRRWHCTVCDKPPSRPPRLRRRFKVLAALLLAPAALAYWLVPWNPADLEPGAVWLMRVGTLVVLAITLWSLARSPPDVSYRRVKRQVEPYDSAYCPFCDRELEPGRRWWRCSWCKLEQRC